MSSYTPITLPYFAPAEILPAPIPTLEQVLSSEEYLKPPGPNLLGKDVRVVRINQFVAKFGRSVRSIEGENMLFVKQHTAIPVPQVYAIYTFGEGKTMLIMEFIEGKSLGRSSATMAPKQLISVMEQLKSQISELRRIPAPGYYGSIGRRPLYDLNIEQGYGPFDTISDMLNGFYDLTFLPRSSQRFADLKRSFSLSMERASTALGQAHPAFTHNDLHEENVIIRQDGTPVMIDYGLAGFWPAYKEYFRAQFLGAYPYKLSDIIADAELSYTMAFGSDTESESD